MKTIRLYLILVCVIIAQTGISSAEKNLSPYLKAGSFKGSIADAKAKVQSSLVNAGFEIIGDYNPENKSNFSVLVYTDNTLKGICIQAKNRAALAAALKVGFVKKGDIVVVSMINPDYLFNAYFQDNYDKFSGQLMQVANKAKKAVQIFNSNLSGFGGSLEMDDVREYQYMWGMEEYTDPVELKEFSSFDAGVKTIEKNLASGKGHTVKVYELKFTKAKVAVFGVGLFDKETGEPFFLPIIGEDHIAAMPYEIILVGNTATILHGRYRIALHWPELTMGTFTKIMSTPGDVEESLKALTE